MDGGETDMNQDCRSHTHPLSGEFPLVSRHLGALVLSC